MAGGFLDRDITPSLSSASGRWEIGDVYAARQSNTFPRPTFSVQYLVIAGGGGGGGDIGGGGGAGGYRCNVSGEQSGGGASAEPALSLRSGNYTITVGAGGVGGAFGVSSVFDSNGFVGSNSSIVGEGINIVASGGGGGGGYTREATVIPNATQLPGIPGGSGGGGSYALIGGYGLAGQGFAGGSGNATVTAGRASGGGGGGAGAVGANAASQDVAGAGGNGVSSSITGSAVTRAGGGGGGIGINSTGARASGGTGGGGTGGNVSVRAGGDATVNTGSGGGGGCGGAGTVRALHGGGAGGSGIVVLTYPISVAIKIGPGLVGSSFTSGGLKRTVFTAGSDVINIDAA